MAQFLDMATSVNSGNTGFPNTGLTGAPELFGAIGLATQSNVNPVISLGGTISLTGEEGDPFTLFIVRGTVFDPASIIYFAEGTVATTGGNELHSFQTADFAPPTQPFINYSAYIAGVSTSIRSGPESFYGIASMR
ncbi:hypothetical protein [Paenibacillus sp. YN15]|uniref:hypothetical protein n=1 Tax=Paenibacillus sp. YN15 TaxID=1742774 RepID=UPI000DCBC998|nr:hypothetical protein [Paenibacillus sp. YN15]RAV00524.1 hypothetical protein DQG13_13850 [Paenibacillus sp. YN15]